MKTHYTFSGLVRNVFLLIGIPFLLGVNLYATEPVRYLITGVQNYDANGIYAQQGYFGENNWPYFKHETANWFLFFNYYPALEEKPFGGGYQPAYGEWVLSTSLGDYPYFAYAVNNVSYYVDPVSNGWYAVGGGGTLSIQLAEPYANTLEATEIGSTMATLNAKFNPMNTNVHVTFLYGTSTSYNNSIVANATPINGFEEIEISKEITGLQPNTTYHYTVHISKQPFGYIAGEDNTFTTTVATNTKETPENQVVLYPNPVKNGFYVNAGEIVECMVVYDVNGLIVLKQFVEGLSYVDIHSLTKGLYVVTLNGLAKKLVKID